MIISIIVPVYNSEDYLERSIQSVINQTDDNWELILVDDGSFDNSAIICDEYAEKYNNIHSFHKQNEGQFLSRQFGVQKAIGDYVGFLDADDFLDKNYISIIQRFITSNDFPEVICFGYCQWNKKIIKEWPISLPIDEVTVYNDLNLRKQVYYQIISGSLTGSMWSKVFKTSVFKSIQIDSTIVKNKRFAEDAFQSFHIIAKANSIAFLQKNLYFYYNNEKSISSGIENRSFDYYNQLYLFESLLGFLSYWGMQDVDSLKTLLAFNFNYTVNYILKYYRSASTSKRRKQVVNYDWSTYLLDMTDDEINNNPYIRKSYIKVWNAFKKKRHFEIYIRERIKKIGWG